MLEHILIKKKVSYARQICGNIPPSPNPAPVCCCKLSLRWNPNQSSTDKALKVKTATQPLTYTKFLLIESHLLWCSTLLSSSEGCSDHAYNIHSFCAPFATDITTYYDFNFTNLTCRAITERGIQGTLTQLYLIGDLKFGVLKGSDQSKWTRRFWLKMF